MSAGKEMRKRKAELHLTKGPSLTVEKLAVMFERLTGKKVTGEELEKARKKFASRTTDETIKD